MILAALALVASAPSFDCAKAATHVEHTICGDEGLSRSDQAVALLYRSAITKKHSKTVPEQRRWLEQRNDCPDESCLLDSYEWRIFELMGETGTRQQYLSNPNNGMLSIQSLGDGWFAFSALALYIRSPDTANDAEASGVFKLVNGRGSRKPTDEYDCGWKIQRLPHNRWKLENWAGSKHAPCGGVNANVEGVYR